MNLSYICIIWACAILLNISLCNHALLCTLFILLCTRYNIDLLKILFPTKKVIAPPVLFIHLLSFQWVLSVNKLLQYCSISIFCWDNFNILYSYMLYHLCKTICLFILLCIAKIMILFSMMLFICISLIFIVVIVIFVFIRSLMKKSFLLIFYTWINIF